MPVFGLPPEHPERVQAEYHIRLVRERVQRELAACSDMTWELALMRPLLVPRTVPPLCREDAKSCSLIPRRQDLRI